MFFKTQTEEAQGGRRNKQEAGGSSQGWPMALAHLATDQRRRRRQGQSRRILSR